MLDPAVAEELLASPVPPVGSHHTTRVMDQSNTPPGTGPPSDGEPTPSSGPGESLAPAIGPHEPNPDMGGTEWGVNYSQTAAASDLGQDIRQSNGEVAVPTPGRISGLPHLWADEAMYRSQPGFTFNPTLYVAGFANRDLYRPGNPRTASRGPESQGMADEFPPAPGAPLGTRYPQGAGGPQGFFGRTVTKARARKVLGPHRRPRRFPKLPRQNRVRGLMR